MAERLIVEVDGGQHAQRAAADARRTRYLEGQGYRVVRFWNNEVLGNLEGCCSG
jgi:very-short-patch-repair endonuclease